jgi:AcrR family transcriptional regulator
MQTELFHKLSPEKQAAIVSAGTEEFSKKSFADANTDVITQACGISKGLLFHYFGTKREFYLYCLSSALEKLMVETEILEGDFYAVLFSSMDHKLRLCAQYPAEMKFVNMASRESGGEVDSGRKTLFAQYGARRATASYAVLQRALKALPLKKPNDEKAAKGLLLYCDALVNQYLLAYQDHPETFFAQAEQIKKELKEYLDFMIYGIAEEQAK